MNKKKIITLIITMVLLIILIYGLKVFLGKDMITGQLATIVDSESTPSGTIECDNNMLLIDIDIETLSGEIEKNSDGHYKMGSSLESIKNQNNFVSKEDKGEIIVELVDENYEVVKSVKVKGGKSESDKFFISKDGTYSITINSKGFNGIYNIECYSYTIY